MYYVIYNWIYICVDIVSDLDILLDGLFEDEVIAYGPASYSACEDYIDLVRWARR